MTSPNFGLNRQETKIDEEAFNESIDISDSSSGGRGSGISIRIPCNVNEPRRPGPSITQPSVLPFCDLNENSSVDRPASRKSKLKKPGKQHMKVSDVFKGDGDTSTTKKVMQRLGTLQPRVSVAKAGSDFNFPDVNRIEEETSSDGEGKPASASNRVSKSKDFK